MVQFRRDNANKQKIVFLVRHGGKNCRWHIIVLRTHNLEGFVSGALGTAVILSGFGIRARSLSRFQRHHTETCFSKRCYEYFKYSLVLCIPFLL